MDRKIKDMDTTYTLVIVGNTVLVVYFTGSLQDATARAEVLASEYVAGDNWHVLEGFVGGATHFED